MRATILAIALFGGLAAACTVTGTVQGVVQNSDERFSGTLKAGMDGSGTLSVTSTKGTTCTGDFVNTTRRQGKGVFQCADGRSGPFEFVTTGSHGNGNGMLGGEIFTFTFQRD